MRNFKVQTVTPNTHSQRSGVSLVEVLFAMMIALFGLAGVLAIFPLAARQAADSYSLNQATNGAMNAAAVAAAAKDVVPSERSPWVLPDDRTDLSGNSTDYFEPPLNNSPGRNKPAKTISRVYEGLVNKTYQSLGGITDVGIRTRTAVRQTVGQGFCYDPLYLASVPITSDYVPGAGDISRPSRMPFFSEELNLLTFNGTGQLVSGVNNTPRLMRVSSLANLNATPLAPISPIVANARVANIGDLVPAAIQKDKSFGALREFEGVDSGSLISASANSDLSWFATIVPAESEGVEYPTQFNVTIVLVKKRDRTFDYPVAGSTTLPPSERLAIVTSQNHRPSDAATTLPGTPASPMPCSSNPTLNVTLHFDARTESTLRVNDYVMLSRNMFWNLPDSTTNGPKIVHRHAWYRVAAIGEAVDNDVSTPELSRDLVLQGRPWDYPDFNTNLNPSSPAVLPPYTFTRTVATVVENVVAVYEYPLNITE